MTKLSTEAEAILELQGISKVFGASAGPHSWMPHLGASSKRLGLLAVDGVDLSIARGEVVSIVGESGCGKSTLGKIIAGIHRPSAGKVLFKGLDLVGKRLGKDQIDSSLKIQMIFQDPSGSLNPRQKVGNLISEGPVAHGMVGRGGRAAFVNDLLELVGLQAEMQFRYPHQFSGGQRQRIGIARALSVHPEVLVCDEAVSALDMSIKAQILNLFKELQEKLGLTYLFISHDLSVVENLSDRVAVMYLGRIVELSPVSQMFSAPQHPYSQALLNDMPRLDRIKHTYRPIAGELPSPASPPRGCAFHPRCPFAFNRCREERPELKVIEPGHYAACHLVE